MGGFKATPEDFEREMIIRRLEERFGRRIKELEQRVDALTQQQAQPAQPEQPESCPCLNADANNAAKQYRMWWLDAKADADALRNQLKEIMGANAFLNSEVRRLMKSLEKMVNEAPDA